MRVGDEESCRERLAEGSGERVVATGAGARAPAALRVLRERIGGVDPALVILADGFEEVAEAAQRLGATLCLRANRFAHLRPEVERALREGDVRRKGWLSTAFEEGLREILESIASGKPLVDVLGQIALLIRAAGGRDAVLDSAPR
ncbi:MAG: hypothetical protein ACJ780_25075 [Solirubrobacteraceae bacterium]